MTSYDSDMLKFSNSTIFTPDNISKQMSSFIKNGSLLDPCVGTGNLLKYINIENHHTIDVYDIDKPLLDSIKETKNLIKHHKDFLQTDIDMKFDNIILNPPYIRFQNLSVECRDYMKRKWNILNTGNIDIYFAFILKCLEVLTDDGVMVSITPNSFLYNKSAYKLRKFILENNYIQEIIDFKSKKVFPTISTYCCITVFTKKKKDFLVYNGKSIIYDSIEDNNIFDIKKMNCVSVCKKLGDVCVIKNGIATLRDKIYIHRTKKYNEKCWREITDVNKNLWIIYPYDEDGKIIKENIFRKSNPNTYAFLLENKPELLKRDKGNKIYPEWYAYGRSQAIKYSTSDRVIYIPTMINPNDIKFKICKPVLYYKSLCIEILDTTLTCEDLVDVILKNKDYIENNSSKRGSGWINLSSSILKNISF